MSEAQNLEHCTNCLVASSLWGFSVASDTGTLQKVNNEEDQLQII